MSTTNENKIILDLCGGTGAWSKPYRDAGYDVRVCTLPDCDVRLYVPPENVHGILAAPPCTEFSIAKNFHGAGNYNHDFIKGLEIVSACMRIILTAKPKWWALENPIGHLQKFLGKPVYTFTAWEFGHSYQKRTALWGDFNPPVKTVLVKPEGIKRFSLLKSAEINPEYNCDRTCRRAVTPAFFAQAFFEANP